MPVDGESSDGSVNGGGKITGNPSSMSVYFKNSLIIHKPIDLLNDR